MEWHLSIANSNFMLNVFFLIMKSKLPRKIFYRNISQFFFGFVILWEKNIYFYI